MRLIYQPQSLIDRALAHAFITKAESKSKDAKAAAEEQAEETSANWPEGNGFGSSDFTYELKGFLNMMGKKTEFKNGRLVLVKESINELKSFEEFIKESLTEDAKLVNEGRARFWIETWYDGGKTQFLGSDGTGYTTKMPTDKDFDQREVHIRSLVKIKPFLKGSVIFKVTNSDGKVLKTKEVTI